MFKKLLSVFLCLTAVFFLASCEKKTKTRKTANGGSEITNTQGGNGSQTHGYGDSTTKGGNQSQTQVQETTVTFTATDFGATGSKYTDFTVSKDGIEYYAHIICKDGILQFRAPKPNDNKEGAVLMNKTAGKTVKSITVVTSSKPYDTRTLNFYGLEEPYADIDEFEGAGLTPVGSIAIKAAGTYTYEFEGSYVYFAFAVSGGAHTFDSISITYGSGSVQPVVVEEADKALDDAIKALDLSNIKINYGYVGKAAGEDDDVLDLVIEHANGKVKISTTYEGNDGKPVTDIYYVETVEGVLRFYFVNYEDESGDEFDWDDIDWDSILSRRHNVTKRTAKDDEEEYVYVKGEDAEYYLDQTGYLDFDFSSIAYTSFNKVGSKYEVKDAKVNEIGKLIFGDYDGEGTDTYYGYDYDYVSTEVFSKVTFELSNGKISKITAKSKYTEVDTWKDDNTTDTYITNYTYTITFSNEGKVSFTIPEATEYVAPAEEVKVANVYELSDGASVSIAAYVNGVNTDEKVIYVCDETGSIALHFDTLENIPAVGKIVEFTATVKVTGKLVELVLTELTIKEEAPAQMTAYEFESFSGVDETYAGEIINLNFAIIKTLDVANKQVVFTTIDGQDVALLFEDAQKEVVSTLFTGAEVGKAINLKNVAVTLSGNDFALRLTNDSQFEFSNALKTDKKEYKVASGTTIANVLKDVVVTFYNNGVKTTLDSESYGINDENYKKDKPGTYEITLTKGDQTAKIFVVVELGEGVVDEFTEDQGKGVEFIANRYGINVGLPSTGDVNVLVIPILFEDTPNSYVKNNNYKTVLDKAFNGTSDETGWESLNSYYQKVSYGKLNITATILDAYDTQETHYETETTVDGKKYPDDFLEGYESLDYKYLVQAIAYYNDAIDYTQYDANNDGYIDCVYLVYLVPHSENSNALEYWWAYTYEYYEQGEETLYDGKGIDFYMWLSYDFFTETLVDDQGNAISNQPTVNAETVIHETGHALGLDDYYDYNNDDVETGGFGGGIMMDTNVGDHDAWSKAILGWINPTVVINKDCELTIESLAKTEGADIDKKAIFIAKDYNGVFYNEFYIIYLYTPTGVNEMMKGNSGLPTETGVMIIHVVANPKANDSEIYSIWDVTANHNGNKDGMLITVVEADKNSSISQNEYLANSDLWQANGKLTNVKWADGSNAGFTVEVKSIADGQATIVIDFAE